MITIQQGAGRSRRRGFTLLELVAVLAMLGLLLVVLSPALARTKPDTYAITCRNNLAQLTKAWTMYAEDNSGSLVYNHDGSMAGRSQSTASWVAGWLDFTTSPDNTNINYLVQHSNQYAWCGFFGSYLRSAAPFKCPADRSVVNYGAKVLPRVRSYSMSNFTGTGARTWTTPSRYNVYNSTQAILSPANVFVLLDEKEESINDGYFFTDPDTMYQVIDFPASRHGWGAGFSFADGHTEIHRWRDYRTVPQMGPGGGMKLNVNLAGDVDILWLANHAIGKP